MVKGDDTVRLAVEVGTVADGTLKGAIQYCKDLEIDRLGVGSRHVPGFEEKGYVDLDALKDVRGQIEDAGMSFSVMVHWAPRPMIMGQPEGAAQFANLCKSIEAMGEVGADILSMFATLPVPEDPQDEEARWGLLVDFYSRLMAQADECGVKVALHTVAMPARNMLWNYRAVERLMKDVPSPGNGVCFCVGNFWNSEGNRMYDVLRRLGEKVFYVHLRSTKVHLGETPFWFDSGGPDFAEVVRVLREINYQGDVRSEHMPEVVGENRTDIGTAWAIGYTKALLQVL
jgi:sugar phosphate isomerase/epimerase